MTNQTESAYFDIDQITAPTPTVDQYMRDYVASASLPKNLIDAIDYALLGGGKRMRPILVIRAAEAVGGTIEQALPPAAAIELIHCFSLVHDDLPAMDDDDLRRGRPTLHIKTNEAMAILAGDAMMSLAFQLLLDRIPDETTAAKIMSELAVGTSAMIGGQVYDTLPDFPSDLTPLDQLKTIHTHKTGALIRGACRMGAVAAKANDEQLAAITTYGEAIGLMFQIVDDLLDITQTTEQLGKTAGKDVEQDKLTYPAVLGVEKSQAEITRLLEVALGALSPLGNDAAQLAQIANYLAVRTK